VVYRKDLIITIDGPSGAGKSTIAKMLAHKLGYRYIDTGAMYRGVAYAYKIKKATLPTEEARLHGGRVQAQTIADLLKNLDIRFEFGKETKVFLGNVDISQEIRDPEISLLASMLSQQKIVREYLYKVQREIGKDGGVVLEGRDTGSIVFPDAHIKIYLDAHTDERAKRRQLELASKGNGEILAKVKEEMLLRDKNDSEREIAPLVMPENAKYIDTTEIDVTDVMNIILEHIAAREVS
jgi:cytidylate kinase